MQSFDPIRYMNRCIELNDLIGSAYGLDDEDAEEKNVSLKEIQTGLARLSRLCGQMGISCTEMIDRISGKITEQPHTKSADDLIDEIQHAIRGELRGRMCFILTLEESTLYRKSELSARAMVAFPQANEEMGHAGECIALGQYQAGVFHAMNALEQPLRVLANYFSVPFDPPATWGPVINAIKDKIDKIDRSKKPNKRKADDALSFFGEAAKEFAYFKDAWRNHVMHSRGSYDEHTSHSIYNHVVSFVEHLSERLSHSSRKRYERAPGRSSPRNP